MSDETMQMITNIENGVPFFKPPNKNYEHKFIREFSNINLPGNVIPGKEQIVPIKHPHLVCGCYFIIKLEDQFIPTLSTTLLDQYFAHIVALRQETNISNIYSTIGSTDYSVYDSLEIATIDKIISPSLLIDSMYLVLEVHIEWLVEHKRKMIVHPVSHGERIKDVIDNVSIYDGGINLDEFDNILLRYKNHEMRFDLGENIVAIPFTIFSDYGKAYPTFMEENDLTLRYKLKKGSYVIKEMKLIIEHIHIDQTLGDKLSYDNDYVFEKHYFKNLKLSRGVKDISVSFEGISRGLMLVFMDNNGKVVECIDQMEVLLEEEPYFKGSGIEYLYRFHKSREYHFGHYFVPFGLELDGDNVGYANAGNLDKIVFKIEFFEDFIGGDLKLNVYSFSSLIVNF